MEKRYQIFDNVLNQINREHISRDCPKGAACRESFEDFFVAFHQLLYNIDPIIKGYKKIQYTGSNADNLMVGTTYNEFDMNLLIKLDNLSVTMSSPGFVEIKCNSLSNMDEEKRKIVNSWLDDNNYILPDEFRQWGESIISKLCNMLPNKTVRGNRGSYLVQMRKSGPAFNLEVSKHGSGITFMIDVVFCLEFDNLYPCFDIIKPNGNVKEWIAVPKTPNDRINTGYKKWRYSFPEAEKKILGDLQHLKSVIRLIKKIRDTNNMSYLPSYYIKVLFMWEIQKQTKNFWMQSQSVILVHMLNVLKNHAENEILAYYWDKRFNLFDFYLDRNQLQDCAIKLTKICINIDNYAKEQNPDGIKNIILTDRERLS